MPARESSGERCVSRNFVLLVTLGDTSVCLIVYFAVYQMKWITYRKMLKQVQVQLYPPEQSH